MVYLELEGVQADIVMIDSAWAKAGTVLLRLPVEIARQLGLQTPEAAPASNAATSNAKS